ncbi:MAG: hypothetical protein KC636_21615 [Myxococcales bacterium]|nr:hypothetical protein [Myxococcales bacterium]
MRVEEPDPFRIEFELTAPERLAALTRIFAALARVKEIQFGPLGDDEDGEPPGWLEDDDPRWAAHLDEAAREHFAGAFDFASEEGRLHRALWELTPPSRRRDPIFHVPGPWSFEAVIHVIYAGEYLLVALERTGPASATLRYEPLAGPFGGTAALVQLVEGFGQRVTFDSWHDGPHPREEVGWDPARARRLIAAGRGVP